MATERGGSERRARRRAETTQGVAQAPWSRFQNRLPPIEFMDEDGLARIEETAFRVLEDLGLEFMSEEALEILARNGCVVDRGSGLVKFPREIVREFIAKAPSSFTLHARNSDRDLIIGGNYINLGPVGGTPNCSDLDRGRRPGSFTDQVELIKLHQCINACHTIGGTQVEAQDLPVATRHLDQHRAQVIYSDRVWGGRAIGRTRIKDAIEIARIARGVSLEEIQRTPSLTTIINTNSPRRVDKELLSGLMEMAENGQAVCVTPFTLAGAMSPITLAGALALQSAEALGVLAFTQMVKPGCPVIFGGFTSNVDMKTGAPAFGTPEYVKATLIGGQIARRYKLPYRASNVCSANSVDAQATYESAVSIWACMMSHANWVHHAFGWLEGGLCSSFEKVVIDAQIWETMRASLDPVDVSDAALAFDAIAGVPPGGHYFGTQHTLDRFETAFVRPMVSDIRNFDSWKEAGSPTATQRANVIWKRLLETYEQPPLDPAKLEAMDAYIARRRTEIDSRGLD